MSTVKTNYYYYYYYSKNYNNKYYNNNNKTIKIRDKPNNLADYLNISSRQK